MSYRAVQSVLRPATRLATSCSPSLRSACPRPSSLLPLSSSSPTPLPLLHLRTKKTKASTKKGKPAVEEDDEFEPAPGQSKGKGGGGKKGKGKGFVEEELLDTQLPGEVFELKVLEQRMAESVDRLRVGLKQVVGRVGRVTPGAFSFPFCGPESR